MRHRKWIVIMALLGFGTGTAVAEIGFKQAALQAQPSQLATNPGAKNLDAQKRPAETRGSFSETDSRYVDVTRQAFKAPNSDHDFLSAASQRARESWPDSVRSEMRRHGIDARQEYKLFSIDLQTKAKRP